MPKAWKIAALLLVLAAAVWLFTRARQQAALSPSLPTVSSPDMANANPAAPHSANQSALESEGDAQAQRALSSPNGSKANAAASNAQAKLLVRLVDEATHEPVPFLRAELTGEGQTLERLESDAQGILRGELAHPEGDYLLDLSSERRPGDVLQTKAKEAQAISAQVKLHLARNDASALTPDLPIPVGPTYLVRSAWPSGLSPASFTAQLRGADARLAFDRLYATVHEGSPAWVRFSPLAKLVSGGPPWSLALVSEDALWIAQAEVVSVIGRTPDTIDLVFEARARIVGRVLDGAGAPRAGATVQAWAPGASFERADLRPLFGHSDAEGRFDLRSIPAARYRLIVEDEQHVRYEEPVEVLAGERIEHDIRLVAPDPATLGNLQVRVTSRTGRFHEKLRVSLVPEAPPRAQRTETVAWKDEGGAQIGSASFGGLMPGDYTLSTIPIGLLEVQPASIRVRHDAPRVELVLGDDVASAELVVRVTQAEDQKPALGFRVLVSASESGRATGMNAQHGAPEVKIPCVPLGKPLALTIEAPGRASVWREVVLQQGAPPLVVALTRGWGAELHVVDAAGKPLTGARVLLDGEEAGRTDARGVLRTTLDHAPQRCQVEAAGWKLAAGGDVSPDTGQFRAWQGFVRIVMEPVK